MPKSHVVRVTRSAALILVLTAGAFAQPQPPTDATLVKDFIHYVKIDSKEMAASAAKMLMDRGLKPSDFANMVETAGLGNEFQAQALRAVQRQELEGLASGLLKSYEQGKLDQARNAAEISKNIGLLTGTQRNRMVAMERLKYAGEYALPQLFQALIQKGDGARQAEVRRVLIELGHQSIIPVATALPMLDPTGQELVVGVLGDIQYGTSLPFIYELRSHTNSKEVRAACELAIKRIAGGAIVDASPSILFTALAEDYYAESLSLTSFPTEPVQLLWTYDPGIGLLPTAIDSAVYHEAMAMRMSERALRLDSQNGQALSLWLAANFKREIETPKGYENPVYAKDRPDAMYYAVAAGPVATQRVLGRAIDTRATLLARRAIAAIERTAGAGGLWDAQGSRNPLLEALRYPNRRVQYEAAVAIGAAQPGNPFDGSNRIVPILASAVRDAAARYAVVVAGAAEQQTFLADILRSKGYDVLPPARSMADAQAAIAERPGIDLIITSLPTKATDDTIAEIHGSPKTAATPVLGLLDAQGIADLGGKYQRDQTVRLARVGLTKEQIGAASEQLVEAAVGGAISADEAKGYKERSLAVLRDLAVSGNQTLSVADATVPLINALSANRGAMKLSIAEVLSFIAGKTAQVAIMDDAMAAQGEERVAMLGKTAASAKRFGNQLEPRQVSRVVDLALKGSGEEATAAAALMGSLNLSNDQLIPLIVGKPEPRKAASGAEAAR